MAQELELDLGAEVLRYVAQSRVLMLSLSSGWDVSSSCLQSSTMGDWSVQYGVVWAVSVPSRACHPVESTMSSVKALMASRPRNLALYPLARYSFTKVGMPTPVEGR